MSLDVYSLCPGGTGKKIKFCCGDLLSELQKIERMLEGEQHVACLQHLDQSLHDTTDRACLLAIKGLLLRGTNQMEAAEANAALFLEKHPQNATALAESAIVTAATQGGRTAMGLLQRALAASTQGIEPRVYEAMGVVAHALLAEGHWLAARAMLQLQTAVNKEDEEPIDVLLDLNQAAEVPLIFKEDPPIKPCPDNVPWKQRFVEAMTPLSKGCWQQAADKLGELAAEVPNSSEIWRNLAVLRGWLADTAGSTGALRRFAALEVPLDDAVEAETLAMSLAADPLGDAVETLKVTRVVRDVERLQTVLLSDPRVATLPVDLSAFSEEDGPRPKGVYMLLDRPTPAAAENLTLDAMSSFLAQLVLYGRQTDREAQLEAINVVATDLPQVNALLAELAGDTLDPNVETMVAGSTSASDELLQRKWRLPRDVSREQLKSLMIQYQRDALLQDWPQLKLGALDGKSAREAAADPTYRIKLLAAILFLQLTNVRAANGFDFNELRDALGLPRSEPIDPRQSPVGQLPLTRLARLVVDQLSDDDLLLAYHRAVAFNIVDAVRRFAQAVIERPSLQDRNERLRAYSVLARTSEDPQEAMQYVYQGREVAAAQGKSSASWDLLELSFRFTRGEGDDALRLVNHIQKEHAREPGVMDALTNILIDVGVLRPDGTPTPLRAPAGAAAAVGPPAPEPGKLWTPESQQPAGDRKLWTPE